MKENNLAGEGKEDIVGKEYRPLVGKEGQYSDEERAVTRRML